MVAISPLLALQKSPAWKGSWSDLWDCQAQIIDFQQLPRRNRLFLPHLSSLALHLSLNDKHSLTRQINITSRVRLKLHHRVSACRYHVCMCSIDAWHTSISRKGIWREGQYRTKVSLIKAHWKGPDSHESHTYTGREQVFWKQNVHSRTYRDIQALIYSTQPEIQSSSTSSPHNVQIWA